MRFVDENQRTTTSCVSGRRERRLKNRIRNLLRMQCSDRQRSGDALQ
jgi:hypothetical protein